MDIHYCHGATRQSHLVNRRVRPRPAPPVERRRLRVGASHAAAGGGRQSDGVQLCARQKILETGGERRAAGRGWQERRWRGRAAGSRHVILRVEVSVRTLAAGRSRIPAVSGGWRGHVADITGQSGGVQRGLRWERKRVLAMFSPVSFSSRREKEKCTSRRQSLCSPRAARSPVPARALRV